MGKSENLLLKLAHGEADAEEFCRASSINSSRNLEIYLRKAGVWDGHYWTYGELANEFDISRPRVVQVCRRTEVLVKKYFEKEKSV